jgi:hypothetical protein
VTRTVTIPDTVPIFFPLLNDEPDNPTFNPPGQPLPNPLSTFSQLQAFAIQFLQPTIDLHASVDGVAIPNLFSHDELSPSFSDTLPDNSILNTPAFGYSFPGRTVVSPVAGDGYYVMLGPCRLIHTLSISAGLWTRMAIRRQRRMTFTSISPISSPSSMSPSRPPWHC